MRQLVFPRDVLLGDPTVIPGLPPGTKVLLRSVVGSTVHGTSVAEQDDHDEMALVLDTPSCAFGVEPFDRSVDITGPWPWETRVLRTQREGQRSGPGDVDLVVHTLRKYIRLATRGNPTILLLLFAPPRYANALGQEILRDRDILLSKHAATAFLGYMRAQRMRLMGESGGRHGRPRQELIDQYGYDTKYAGHIIRLGYQGVELVRSGRITLPMVEAERNDVVSIRTGGWPLSRVVEYGEFLEARLRAAMFTSPLPEQPDIAAINARLASWYSLGWAS